MILFSLVRSMEHVASVMKKKIFPPLYEASKSAFVEKILPTSQVQYGYQGDRYASLTWATELSLA